MTHPPPSVATLMLMGCVLRKRPGSANAWAVTPAESTGPRLCFGKPGSAGRPCWYFSGSAARLTDVLPWDVLPFHIATQLPPATMQAYIDCLNTR